MTGLRRRGATIAAESDVEQVLGLPRDALPKAGRWRGVRRVPLREVLALVDRVGTFRPRPEAEEDPSWKQVIPYLVLRDSTREPDDLFLLRRTRAGADARLHERRSIGIGGHVGPADAGPMGGLRREWREEMVASFMPRYRYLGLLNDDSDPVGSVHVGLVFVADARGRPVAVRETHKLEGGWAATDAIALERDRLETWSALVLDALVPMGDPTARRRRMVGQNR
jgi:predicted NUDIX family phosphoesterase